MRLSIGQHLQQKQVQTLAPRMIQSMEILQLPITQLQERIDQEMNENPLLEMLDADPALPEEPKEEEKPTSKSEDEKELVVDNEHNNADDFERLLNLQNEVPEQSDEYTRPSSNRIEESSERKLDTLANIEDRPETLHEYLIHQLGELDLDDDLYRMCERIISSLDPEDGGYLRASLMDLLPASCGPDQIELAEKALDVIHQLDPPGVAARDLKECLTLQITPKTPFADQLRTLINDHLDDLYHNRIPLIQRATGYSLEMIQATVEQLKKLNPKPAAFLVERQAPSVTPDLFVELDDNGEYKVRLADDYVRSLYISNYYRKRLASGQATPEEKEYIKKKVNSAQWLIDAIEQRRQTLSKVSQAIVDHQTDFLENGPEHIEPLKMQQIADKVGVHVTTVSRAVDDKWIQTPRGIFSLKRFFVGGTRTDEGEDVAWDIVRIKLQDLVDHEDKAKPLSDDELVKRLKAQGINVARRTITKYRQKMGIPSSRQRRDWSLKSGSESKATSNTSREDTIG